MGTQGNIVIAKARALAQQAKEDRLVPYLLKACCLVLALFLISRFAPSLPAVTISLILVVYALLSTLGALYQIPTGRKHRQFKLIESGKLSRINRRWALSLILLFLGSLLSGLIYILESPRWDSSIWILNWAAIPFFFLIYQVVKWRLSTEFKPWYLKARAMRWSFFIAAILLCILYAVFSSYSAETYSSVEEAFELTLDPFAVAQSSFLSDLSYISTFTDGFTAYGIAIIESKLDGLQVIAFAIRFIAYASVILSLVSQFGFCLLSAKEIESEFRLLPDTDKEDEQTRLIKRYFVFLGILTILSLATFNAGEYVSLKIQESPELSPIRTRIDLARDQAVLRIDKVREYEQEHEQNQADEETRNATLSEQVSSIEELYDRQITQINDYYNGMNVLIDSYADSCYRSNEGFFERLFRFIRSMVIDAAKEQFKKDLAEYAETSKALQTYRENREEIGTCARYLARITSNPSTPQSEVDAKAEMWNGPDLLIPWQTDGNENQLPTPNDDENEDQFKERLKNQVKEKHDLALNDIEKLQSSIRDLATE